MDGYGLDNSARLNKNKNFRDALVKNKDNNINFIDGSIPSIYLRARKIRGVDFMRFLMKNSDVKKKRNLILGGDSATEEGLKKLSIALMS